MNNTNRNQWRNQRNQMNLNPMPPFGTMHYYSTDAVKSEMTKTFEDDMFMYKHNLPNMPNPLQKNLADTIVTAENHIIKVKPQVYSSEKPKMERETRSDYYPSLSSITTFFSGVFSALSGGMFQRRTRSPAPQYYDCFDRTEESPPLDWQGSKREDLNKSALARDQSPVGEGRAMSDCGAAVAQCEDKLNRIRLLLASKPTTTTPKFRRRPRKAFVEPGCVEESFEDAFSPEDFSRLANEPYVECFSPCNHHKEELIEAEAPKIKTECISVNIETNKETNDGVKLETEKQESVVKETKDDCKAEVIAACEDKVNKLKELLQRRKPRRTTVDVKSADSNAEPVQDKEDERASNHTKCIRIDIPLDKPSKKLRGSDKRKKSNILKTIKDDMTFAQEIDTEEVCSPDSSPLIKPTQLCDLIEPCLRVNEVKPEVEEPEDKPSDYFDEIAGRFRTSSPTDSEDSFQIVFTDDPQAERLRLESDCDSEDSFIVFEDSPDSCYTSNDVFGDQSDSEGTHDESDSDTDVSDSGCGVSCRLTGSFSRTVGDLTDDSLFDDTVRESSDSEDEVDSAVRTICEEIPELDVVAAVSQKSTGLLIDDVKKQLRKQQPKKKVRFSDKPPTVRVMRVWAFAARAARAGNWERDALDRERFKRRIADVDVAISWVLNPQYRRRVEFQRFRPWWNKLAREELAEKRRLAEEERVKAEERAKAEEERVKEERAKNEEERVKAEERAKNEEERAKNEEDRANDEGIETKRVVNEVDAGDGEKIGQKHEGGDENGGKVVVIVENGVDAEKDKVDGVKSLSKCDFYDRNETKEEKSIEMPKSVT